MAQPPSFYGSPPRIQQLPQPIDVNGPLTDAASDAARTVGAAANRVAETDGQLADYRLQTENIERQRELQRQTGAKAVDLATAYGQLQVDVATMRSEAAPGAEGHEAKVEERIGRFRDDMVASLGNDPDLVARFADNIAQMAASVRTEEAKYAIVERAKQSVANGEHLMGQIANNIATAIANGEDIDTPLKNGIGLWQTYVASQPITGNAAIEYDRQGKAAFASSGLNALANRNPQIVVDRIDKGDFNSSGLNADELRVIRARAQSELDRQAREAETAANEGGAVARAQGRVLVEQVGEGVMVKTEELQAALATAEADPTSPENIALAHDLRVAIAKNAVTDKYDSATNADRLAARREIEAKKDWQKDEQLVAAHAQLGTLIARDKTAAKADPLSLYVRQTGTALPPAQINDRDSMVRRFATGDRVAQRYGVPPTHLTEQEAQGLREEWKNGTAATRADMIQLIGTYGSKRGREIMRQLAPTSPELARLTEMGAARDPALRQTVREAMDGWAQPDSKAVDNASMDAQLRRHFGAAMALMPGERRDAIKTVATFIYKHRAAEANVSGFNADLWNGAVRSALGEGNGTGGMARARSGEQYILPSGVTRGDFAALMAGSGPREFRNAANGVPKWHGGRDLTEAEFKKLTPVLVRDDGEVARYAFRSGANTVKTESGGDYILDLRLLARQRQARR